MKKRKLKGRPNKGWIAVNRFLHGFFAGAAKLFITGPALWAMLALAAIFGAIALTMWIAYIVGEPSTVIEWTGA